MRRRDMVLGFSLAAAFRTAWAEQSHKVHHIALVDPVTPVSEITEVASFLARGFSEELRRRGWIEGQNLLMERFSGEARAEHYPELAQHVIDGNAELICVFGHRLLLDFKALTSTIPLLGIFTDPVSLGIVSSLSRPGGNITAVSIDTGFEIYGKRFQLL